MKEYEKDVHTEHCCQLHGCKYGDRVHCSVVCFGAPQSHPCEFCATEYGDEDEYAKAYELNEMFNRGQRWVLGMLATDVERRLGSK